LPSKAVVHPEQLNADRTVRFAANPDPRIFCAEEAVKNIKIAYRMRTAARQATSSFFNIFLEFFWNRDRPHVSTISASLLGSQI
jgi:hypothetical protein